MELYDLKRDISEQHDLAAELPRAGSPAPQRN